MEVVAPGMVNASFVNNGGALERLELGAVWEAVGKLELEDI